MFVVSCNGTHDVECRRKECDEIKPSCGRCTSRGLLCLEHSDTIKQRASSNRYRVEVVTAAIVDSSSSDTNTMVRLGSGPPSSVSRFIIWI